MKWISWHGEDLRGKIDTDTVLFVSDVPEVHRLRAALGHSVPRAIVNDHLSTWDLAGHHTLTLPLFFANSARKPMSVTHGSAWHAPNIFNFMVNRVQVNRAMCAALVEHFALERFDYSFCEPSSVTVSVLHQYFAQTPQRDGSPVPVTALCQPLQKIHQRQQGRGVISSQGLLNWNLGLRNLFENSMISLITETVDSDDACVFTEKTLFAVAGMTFPIWVGGRGQVDAWRSMGFDTFDDVLVNRYQDFDTVAERCYHAIADNLSLLRDWHHVTALRKQHWHRLEHNRQWLLSQQVLQYCQNNLATWPKDIQKALRGIHTPRWLADLMRGHFC